ncbi:uncharacterized protein LOC144144368 [Haemaphysalis longicornis]
MLNSGTIVFCYGCHVAASYHLSRNVRVEAVKTEDEEEAVRIRVFLTLAGYYSVVFAVKGLILYHVYGFYQQHKANPPPTQTAAPVVQSPASPTPGKTKDTRAKPKGGN